MPYSSRQFWIPFVVSIAIFLCLFLWELGTLSSLIWSPPRPPATTSELVFTAIIILLLGLDIGLFNWQRKHGSCPLGVKRATGIAGLLGAFSLICPACVLLPIGIVGTGLTLAIFAPFLPLIRIISIILLVVALAMLWPKKK